MKLFLTLLLATTTFIGVAQNDLSSLNLSNSQEHSHAGWALAIDGDWLAIAAPHADTDIGTQAGTVEIFHYENEAWGLHQVLTAMSDGEAFENFGYDVDLKDGVLVVGAVGSFDKGPMVGCAYVFELEENSWESKQIIYPGDYHHGMHYGNSVATNGKAIVVGSMLADGNKGITGAVYVYEKSMETWEQANKIIDPNGSVHDRFGSAIAINSAGTIVVGAYHNSKYSEKTGAAFVFEYEESNWTITDTLRTDLHTENDMFGYSVDISNHEIVVGAYHADGNETNSGSVYTFNNNSGDWEHESTIFPNDGKRNDLFGAKVSITDERLLVSAPRTDEDGFEDMGTAYLYEKEGDNFVLQTIFAEPTVNQHSNFGLSMAMDSTQIFIGARFNDDANTDAGAIYYTGEPDATGILDQLELNTSSQVFPNPTTDQVAIDYYVPFAASVELGIFSIDGKNIKTLVSDNLSTGKYQNLWDCTNGQGARVTAGTYMYRLSINDNMITNKITVVD